MTKKEDRVIKALREAAKTIRASGNPEIYVAHLGAYVAGELKGNWIEPSSDTDELWLQIRQAVGAKEGEEFEWAIHDYSAFPDLGEHPSVEDIARVSELLEDNDDAEIVAAALDECNKDVPEAADLLRNGYSTYTDEEDCGEQYVDNIGIENLSDKEQYVDLDKLARDLEMDGTMVNVNGKPYFFNN